MRFLPFIAAASLLASCSSPRPGKTLPPGMDTVVASPKQTEVPGTAGDTLVIAGRSAVIYQPDSVQIEKAKKENGDDFYTVADDYVYFMSDAARFLDSMKCPVLYTHNERYLKFLGAKGAATLIRKDTLPNLWGMYLFDGRALHEVDMTNMVEEYKSVFH